MAKETIALPCGCSYPNKKGRWNFCQEAIRLNKEAQNDFKKRYIYNEHFNIKRYLRVN